jgi:alpha-beta hydrolase superfamily lysophospholipase
MVESFPLASEQASAITQPVILQVAGEDRVVSAQASLDFFERLSGKKNQLFVYPGSFHEVFNDLDRDKALADLKKFLNSYLGA